jgi:hypothetical protein
MTGNELLQEPQKGIEPLTARAGNGPQSPLPSGDEQYTRAVLPASAPEQASKVMQGQRTDSERRLKLSAGPSRPGFLTECQLADRWHRSFNTLVGWRTRPLPNRNVLRYEWHDGSVYYHITVIEAFEADPANAWIRPADRRSLPLPPLTFESQVERLKQTVADLTPPPPKFSHPIAFPTSPAQPELPLSLAPGSTDHVPPPRGFKSLRVEAGYALAIATDDTAFFASVLGGLEYLNWVPVRSLPSDDEILARFTRRAAA